MVLLYDPPWGPSGLFEIISWGRILVFSLTVKYSALSAAIFKQGNFFFFRFPLWNFRCPTKKVCCTARSASISFHSHFYYGAFLDGWLVGLQHTIESSIIKALWEWVGEYHSRQLLQSSLPHWFVSVLRRTHMHTHIEQQQSPQTKTPHHLSSAGSLN